ncbi:hypothetical protein CEXT_425671 [Caerostris extrusa]|uniref:Uncharacterized protein n=1 Tax=Caerostris extrusa TaxID=172846 RepID=A0AAV4XXP4_CAEEX|nr:hypothetical protein CEXT_425671 [Caerostris extrusa]
MHTSTCHSQNDESKYNKEVGSPITAASIIIDDFSARTRGFSRWGLFREQPIGSWYDISHKNITIGYYYFINNIHKLLDIISIKIEKRLSKTILKINVREREREYEMLWS